MDHPIAIDDEQDVAATPLPDDLMAVVVRLIEYAATRVTAARRAIRRAALDALRALVSEVALLLTLAARPIVRWDRVTVADAMRDSARTLRHLHHPPQAWSAP